MKYRDFVEKVAQRANCSKRDAQNMLKVLAEVLPEALEAEGRVAIPGIGVFTIKNRPERLARNPRTGEPLVIKAGRSVGFKTGATMKRRLQESRGTKGE